MKIHERILRARQRPVSPMEVMAMTSGNAPEYQAFIETEGYPERGFTLFCADGNAYGFLYPNMDNLHLRQGQHREHITFSHRGISVTVSGRGLYGAFHCIMQQTLMALYEYHDGYAAPEDASPIIDDVRVTILPGAGLSS